MKRIHKIKSHNSPTSKEDISFLTLIYPSHILCNDVISPERAPAHGMQHNPNSLEKYQVPPERAPIPKLPHCSFNNVPSHHSVSLTLRPLASRYPSITRGVPHSGGPIAQTPHNSVNILRPSDVLVSPNWVSIDPACLLMPALHLWLIGSIWIQSWGCVTVH